MRNKLRAWLLVMVTAVESRLGRWRKKLLTDKTEMAQAFPVYSGMPSAFIREYPKEAAMLTAQRMFRSSQITRKEYAQELHRIWMHNPLKEAEVMTGARIDGDLSINDVRQVLNMPLHCDATQLVESGL